MYATTVATAALSVGRSTPARSPPKTITSPTTAAQNLRDLRSCPILLMVLLLGPWPLSLGRGSFLKDRGAPWKAEGRKEKDKISSFGLHPSSFKCAPPPRRLQGRRKRTRAGGGRQAGGKKAPGWEPGRVRRYAVVVGERCYSVSAAVSSARSATSAITASVTPHARSMLTASCASSVRTSVPRDSYAPFAPPFSSS